MNEAIYAIFDGAAAGNSGTGLTRGGLSGSTATNDLLGSIGECGGFGAWSVISGTYIPGHGVLFSVVSVASPSLTSLGG